jgi:hypothetical protein
MWVCWFLLKDNLKPYPQLPALIIGGFFGIIGLLSVGVGIILAFWGTYKVEVFPDSISIRTISGYRNADYALSDVVGLSVVDKKHNNSKWQLLTIVFRDRKLKISSQEFRKFDALRDQLQGLLPKLKEVEDVPQQKISRDHIVYFVFAALLFCGALKFYSNKQDVILPRHLITIKDVLTNEAEISHGAKGSSSIYVHLKSYPDFSFSLSGVGLVATNSYRYVSNVKKGDTLWLDILESEYKSKLTKEMPISYMDRSVNYHFIGIYGLRDKEHTYLELSDFNKGSSEHNEVGIFIFLVGTFLVTVLGIRKYNRR